MSSQTINPISDTIWQQTVESSKEATLNTLGDEYGSSNMFAWVMWLWSFLYWTKYEKTEPLGGQHAFHELWLWGVAVWPYYYVVYCKRSSSPWSLISLRLVTPSTVGYSPFMVAYVAGKHRTGYHSALWYCRLSYIASTTLRLIDITVQRMEKTAGKTGRQQKQKHLTSFQRDWLRGIMLD